MNNKSATTQTPTSKTEIPEWMKKLQKKLGNNEPEEKSSKNIENVKKSEIKQQEKKRCRNQTIQRF
jgi:RNA-splicing ligase RtcB